MSSPIDELFYNYGDNIPAPPAPPAPPVWCFYDSIEDLVMDSVNNSAYSMADLPEPPVKIEDITGTQQLLEYISYIETHQLYHINPIFKYIVKVKEPIQTLNNMIGMKEIKKSIANQVLYYCKKLGQNNGKLDASVVSFLNTAIYGSPGCGKTTMARVIGQIYLKLGILSKGEFVVGRRDNMIAKYLGQTAIKTKEFLDENKGNVIFLDEVYQFGSGRSDGNRDSFAKEMIDTMNQFITDNPGEVVIIVAGYRDKVKDCFFAQNAGLERRFRWSYTIEDYDHEELLAIFYKQATERNFTVVAPELDQTKTSYTTRRGDIIEEDSSGGKFFKKNKTLFKFGGGDTETLLDKCIMVNEKRTIIQTTDEGKICSVDFEKGFDEYKKYVDDRKVNGDKPPHGMYI